MRGAGVRLTGDRLISHEFNQWDLDIKLLYFFCKEGSKTAYIYIVSVCVSQYELGKNTVVIYYLYSCNFEW